MADNNSSNPESTAECPICLGFHNLDKFIKTACNHQICASCAVELMKVTRKCPLCRKRIKVFDITWVVSGEAVVKPFSTINDGVYIQGNMVGLASYHFSEEENYISYKSAPQLWRLDDGSAPPEKKPFENASYSADTRIFSGDINWTPVGFGGDAKWVYRIVFSEDFMEIESGEVRAYDSEGNEQHVHIYGMHLFYNRLIELDQLLISK